MQHVGGRPVIRRPLRIVRYRDMKRHDISISLLGYDMITSPDLPMRRGSFEGEGRPIKYRNALS